MHKRPEDPGESRESLRNPWRSGAFPIKERRLPSHCDFGDRIRYADGREAIVTCFITGTAFGRFLEEPERVLKELPEMPCVRVSGYR